MAQIESAFQSSDVSLISGANQEDANVSAVGEDSSAWGEHGAVGADGDFELRRFPHDALIAHARIGMIVQPPDQGSYGRIVTMLPDGAIVQFEDGEKKFVAWVNVALENVQPDPSQVMIRKPDTDTPAAIADAKINAPVPDVALEAVRLMQRLEAIVEELRLASGFVEDKLEEQRLNTAAESIMQGRGELVDFVVNYLGSGSTGPVKSGLAEALAKE